MNKALDSALRFLARREHSLRELGDKLQQRGFNLKEIKEALATCQNLDLQNDARFVEVYSRSRIRQGYGPLKISQELNSKGIDKELIQALLQQEQDNWLSYAADVWQKKTQGQPNLSYNELQKSRRFLLYRGFSADTVGKLLKELK